MLLNIPKPAEGWRRRLHEIIFESDTPEGKAFDIVLLWAILISVALVTLDSVAAVRREYGQELFYAEWFFTLLFTVEFLLRLVSVRKPLRYVFSFYGLVDLLAILPTYASMLIPGAQSLLVVRAFRLLRVFRIFKLGNHLEASHALYFALRASRPKITVFLVGVGAAVLTMGALMYLVEGEANGFTSIPTGIYWAIVTMTTVGFGDITPKTPLGQVLASGLMILGYGVIAVPTGIVTSEIVRAGGKQYTTQACPECSREGHDVDASHCKFCGSRL